MHHPALVTETVSQPLTPAHSMLTAKILYTEQGLKLGQQQVVLMWQTEESDLHVVNNLVIAFLLSAGDNRRVRTIQ